MTTKEAYIEYLKSDHWKSLRAEVIKRDGCCKRCGSKVRLQAHHEFYRPRWEDAIAEDLITLCRQCHEKQHGIKPEAVTTPPSVSITFQFTTLESLIMARSTRQIDRKTFKALRAKMIGEGHKIKKKKRRIKRKKRNKGGRTFWKNSVRLFSQHRPNWVNRDNSSN